jgi:hypothetical protein
VYFAVLVGIRPVLGVVILLIPAEAQTARQIYRIGVLEVAPVAAR